MIERLAGEYIYLSTIFLAPCVYDGVTYRTAEHAFQAARLDSTELRNKIKIITSPFDVKSFAKSLPPRRGWGTLRLKAMEEILTSKFSDTVLAQKLLSTGHQEIVHENNWKDVYWGKFNGVGANHLGVLLMKVRDNLFNTRHPTLYDLGV